MGDALASIGPACPLHMLVNGMAELSDSLGGLAGWATLGSGHVLLCCMNDLSS